MDKIINWLLLVIIFVFDPLAIALVIAANFAFANLKGKTPEEEVANQVERKAKQVKAPTPESNPTPSDIEERDLVEEVLNEEGLTTEDLKFEPMVPEGKDFNTPYPFSDLTKDKEEEIIEKNEDIEETYSEKLKPSIVELHKKYGVTDYKKMKSSLKFCVIAAGEFDLYVAEPRASEWDIAAGHAILKNAGGIITDHDGNEINYGKKNFKNPSILLKRGINL